MLKWVEQYIQGCATCQESKIWTHQPKTSLYKILVLEWGLPFWQIAMDLIIGLLTTKKHNMILTIIDHGCSRVAIFLPISDTIMGAGITQLYMDHIYWWYGLPEKIISNWDPHFTSHFSRELTKKLAIGQNLSTVFHPQTNGLSEWKNQWIEQYLQVVLGGQPEQWDEWLALALAVHNNWMNSTIQMSPNEALIRYQVKLLPDLIIQSHNLTVEEQIELVKERHDQAIQALNHVVNASPLPHTQYKIEDQVWLKGTYLKMQYQSSKLAPKCYGPFRIVKVISPVAYQLRLPPTWKIHDVFHASLLSPYRETTAHRPNFSWPPPDLISGEEEYEVESILNHWRHGRLRALQYLIKWKGYPHLDNMWEPADQVHAPELTQAYQRKQAGERDINLTNERWKRDKHSPLPNTGPSP